MRCALLSGLLGGLPGACTTKREPALERVAEVQSETVFIDWSTADSALARLELSDSLAAAAGRARVDDLRKRQAELEAWVVPLQQRYLPAGTELQWRVYLGANLDEPLFIDRDHIQIDVSSPVWNERKDALWEALVSALYRQALDRTLWELGVPTARDVGTEVLTQLLRQGLVAHVTRQGRPMSVSLDDSRILADRRALADRFAALDEAILAYRRGDAAMAKSDAAALWRRLTRLNAELGLYASIGAWMAEAIERESGRAALVATIAGGGRAFYDAYQRTGPGALLNFRLPEDVPVTVPVEPVAH